MLHLKDCLNDKTHKTERMNLNSDDDDIKVTLYNYTAFMRMNSFS